MAVREGERVRGPDPGGRLGRGVRHLQRGELVRDRHVRSSVAGRRERPHDLPEPVGRDGQRHVEPVESDGVEGGVLHRRRAAVRDRMAEHAAERPPGHFRQRVGERPLFAARADW